LIGKLLESVGRVVVTGNIGVSVLARPGQLRVRSFSKHRRDANAFFAAGAFHVGDHVYHRTDCGLKGIQNIPNVLAAVTVDQKAGVDPDRIAGTLRALRGIRKPRRRPTCTPLQPH